MLNYIRKKVSFLFASIMLSVGLAIAFPIAFYLHSEFATSQIIVIASLLVFATVFITVCYGWLGLISSVSIFFFFVMMTTTLKFLEVRFSWMIALALLATLILAINNCLLLLEKTRLNMCNNWSLQKAFHAAHNSAFIINIDKYIITFGITAIVFLVNSGPIVIISSVFVVFTILSFLINTLVNQYLLQLFISLPVTKKARFMMGFSNKLNFQINGKPLPIARGIRHLAIAILILGLLIVIVLASVDAAGVGVFQSSAVIEPIGKPMITNAIISLACALAFTFVYTTIRYRWSFALATVITTINDLFLLFFVFVITRLTINEFFIASLLLVPVMSVTFSTNLFRDLKNRIETHVNAVDKKLLIQSINREIKQTKLRVIFTFVLMLVAFMTVVIFEPTNIFLYGLLGAFVISFISSKFLSLFIWQQLEIHRLKQVEKRVATGFWKTNVPEEQIVHGINNYNP